MKIALVCNAYPPEFVGGTEMVVAAQAKELQRAGHQVRVICGLQSNGGDFRPRMEFVEGVEVVRIAKTEVESSTAHWQFARLVRVVAEASRDFDVIHVHHWASLSGDLVRRLSNQAPVVLTVHDYYASCPRFFRTPLAGLRCPSDRPTDDCVQCVLPLVGEQGPTDVHQRLSERWTNFQAELEAAHQVITPSEHLRGALARQMDISNEDWEVLPHGLCQAVGEVQKNEEHEGPLTVLSFGNRSAVKGTLDLVQAMAALPAGSARLIMPGSEVEEGFDDLLRAAAGDLELELPGRYSAEDLPLYAARADLAAFPSRAEESYGLVIEEALAMGLPVWVSDRGALPEVLTRAAGSGPLPGGILPAEDPAAWTRALEKLVEEPQRLEDARASIPKQPKPAVQAVQRQLEIYAKILDVLPAKDS